MKFEKLLESSGDLLAQMMEAGFSEGYAKGVKTELRWLARNGDSCASLEDACRLRTSKLGSPRTAKKVRSIYGLINHYLEFGECAGPGEGHVLFERGAHLGLTPRFREVVDEFVRAAEVRGLRKSTVDGCVSCASTFFLALQGLGLGSLDEVTEPEVVSLFGDHGACPQSWSYRESVAMVLSCELGRWGEAATRVLSFLPRPRRSRKNIPYLTEDEVARVRAALSSEGSGLCLRDRAIGWLLLLTGMRCCDIAGMLTCCVDWEMDEIGVTQQKTGEPLTLPLLPTVGNAILDYVEQGRPSSDDAHLFLSLRRPHGPISSQCVRDVASRIYAAAGVREGGKGHGAHLFRHHAATRMVDSGVPRAVVSATLGHADPSSLDRYLTADIERLRSCSLSLSRFPLRDGVYG